MPVKSNLGIKKERVVQILEMLEAGKPRDEIADQFGYSTWKSLDIYMRRHGFSWDGQRHIYKKTLSEDFSEKEVNASFKTHNTLADVSPDDIIRLFNTGILDARDIAKRTGFPGHKEMAAYMRHKGYIWSSDTMNYINSNPSTNTEDTLPEQKQIHIDHSLSELRINDKYLPLLEFLWESRDKLIKVIEAEKNDKGKIKIYNIPGQAKTKSIFLSDRLSDLMIALCEKHNISQRQGYEAALVEYLASKGFQDKVEQLLEC